MAFTSGNLSHNLVIISNYCVAVVSGLLGNGQEPTKKLAVLRLHKGDRAAIFVTLVNVVASMFGMQEKIQAILDIANNYVNRDSTSPSLHFAASLFLNF